MVLEASEELKREKKRRDGQGYKGVITREGVKLVRVREAVVMCQLLQCEGDTPPVDDSLIQKGEITIFYTCVWKGEI